jgi:hypothetical protein
VNPDEADAVLSEAEIEQILEWSEVTDLEYELTELERDLVTKLKRLLNIMNGLD